MKKTILSVSVLLLFFLSINSQAEEGKGQIEIATDIEDALIYVNGKKKATAGEGYTTIRLPEGEYKVKVEKLSDDGQWSYRGTKNIFVGEDTFIKISIKTQKFPVAKDILTVPQTPAKKIPLSPAWKPVPEKITPENSGDTLVDKAIQDLKFVLLKPGRFMMGSPYDAAYRDDDEDPHEVEIKQAFYMQTTEITQKQWKAVMGENPSKFKKYGGDCPVENVSWEDVEKFITKLNRMLKTDKYRLPTEAEWEYACRAGATTLFSFGQCLSSRQANFDNTHPMKDCPKWPYEEKPVPVASFSPNAWGLYDMHGNVWEWCQDWKITYPLSPVSDSSDTSSKKRRITRGGSWYNEARDCRSANRGSGSPDYYSHNLGFRLVKTP
ncbi:formylglycine-generating enzyme family protein [Desulfococcaceae bacterium HSG7]|nr:formylglycine-generating enzyme family protein [Desulfococcaceae bacterium HSG7]